MSAISDQAREREIRRRLVLERARRAAPDLLPDYVKMLAGTVIGFGLVSYALRRFTSVDPVYVLASVALAYSLRTRYYKLRLAADPSFAIPKCGCAGINDRTEAVLRSSYGAVLGVPNEILGAALYVALLTVVSLHRDAVATALAVVAVSAAAYLGYAMVLRIGALCATCVTIAGLNILILWQVL